MCAVQLLQPVRFWKWRKAGFRRGLSPLRRAHGAGGLPPRAAASSRQGSRPQMTEAANPQSANESSIHYAGWAVAAAAFVGVMTSFAPIVPYTFSLFLNPLHAAFGWQREAIGGTFALAAITVALVSPGIGALLDRFAPRRIILPSILIFALALISHNCYVGGRLAIRT